MKKGFTLIELLAIIVILAIIAIVTVPIILGIVEEARMKSAINSAYGYTDAINKTYFFNQLEDNSYQKFDGTYSINNSGNISKSSNNYEVNVSGEKPTSGSLSYENNVLKSGCLIINEYKVQYQNGKFISEGKGECSSSIIYYSYNSGTWDNHTIPWNTEPVNDPDPSWYIYMKENLTEETAEVCAVSSGKTICVSPLGSTSIQTKQTEFEELFGDDIFCDPEDPNANETTLVCYNDDIRCTVGSDAVDCGEYVNIEWTWCYINSDGTKGCYWW